MNLQCVLEYELQRVNSQHQISLRIIASQYSQNQCDKFCTFLQYINSNLSLTKIQEPMLKTICQKLEEANKALSKINFDNLSFSLSPQLMSSTEGTIQLLDKLIAVSQKTSQLRKSQSDTSQQLKLTWLQIEKLSKQKQAMLNSFKAMQKQKQNTQFRLKQMLNQTIQRLKTKENQLKQIKIQEQKKFKISTSKLNQLQRLLNAEKIKFINATKIKESDYKNKKPFKNHQTNKFQLNQKTSDTTLNLHSPQIKANMFVEKNVLDLNKQLKKYLKQMQKILQLTFLRLNDVHISLKQKMSSQDFNQNGNLNAFAYEKLYKYSNVIKFDLFGNTAFSLEQFKDKCKGLQSQIQGQFKQFQKTLNQKLCSSYQKRQQIISSSISNGSNNQDYQFMQIVASNSYAFASQFYQLLCNIIYSNHQYLQNNAKMETPFAVKINPEVNQFYVDKFLNPSSNQMLSKQVDKMRIDIKRYLERMEQVRNIYQKDYNQFINLLQIANAKTEKYNKLKMELENDQKRMF